ncbi:MAG: tRNA pseudouridine(55) synthase TruB [Thermodesulfovibrionia bacterium]
MELIINLNKPEGITSQKITLKAKKILNAKKAGHTGTLDPSATGILLICLNRATRLASYFSSLDKEYRAVIKLGEATDTQDAEGNVIEKSDRIEVDRAALKNTLKSFMGKILQKPPMFSALKFKGKPLYKYAKKGIDIPRKLRKVQIHNIELLDISPPFVSIKVVCSKGTYIRTLSDDIGRKLGTVAHLFKLERTAVGPFNIKDAVRIEELNSLNLNHLHDPVRKNALLPKGACPVGQEALLPNGTCPVGQEALLPKGTCPVGQEALLPNGIYTMDSALSWMPELKIKESLVRGVKNGIPIKISECHDFPDSSGMSHDILTAASGIKIKSPEGQLIAIGSFLAGNKVIKTDVVFSA